MTATHRIECAVGTWSPPWCKLCHASPAKPGDACHVAEAVALCVDVSEALYRLADFLDVAHALKTAVPKTVEEARALVRRELGRGVERLPAELRARVCPDEPMETDSSRTDPAPTSHVARICGDMPKAALEDMLTRIVGILFYDDDGHVLRAKALDVDDWQAIREAVAAIAPVSVRRS